MKSSVIKMASRFMIFCSFVMSSGAWSQGRAECLCESFLKAAEVARVDFSSLIKGHPRDTDFQKYAADISHYEMTESEGLDTYVVRFKLKKNDSVITGGAAKYSISKFDLKIVGRDIEK